MKIKYIILIFISAITASCSNMLNVDESTGVPAESIFLYFERASQMLTSAYVYLPSDFRGVDTTMRACATDEAEYVWNHSNIRFMNDGSWSKQNTVDAQWSNFYAGIRVTNLFLEKFTLESLEVYKYQSAYNDYAKQFNNYPYEARFLRAFFHFELAKRYGAIPLVTKSLTNSEANQLTKSSFTDVINFIVSECDAVTAKLPVAYTAALMPGAQTGRITKGAAMALKARALLYAASTLHNPSNNIELWKAAAKASLALIDSAETKGWYCLTTGFFDTNSITSKELILERREAKSNYFEADNYPVGIDGGRTGVCPSQNLVDAFEMKNGIPFDWSNPSHASTPFSNRDPRLAKTILTDGATFKGTVIDVSYGGTNGAPKDGASKTGYYLNKFIVNTVNFTPVQTTSDHCWPLFRYGEVLLNYAEAMNEIFSPSYSDATYTRSAEWSVNKVRTRATMPAIIGLNQNDFRTRIRNERRVELAFEDHRFWDVRRWEIASAITIYGTKVEKSGLNRKYTPSQIVSTRFWDNRMYLYPIPVTETLINPNLGQNPGW